MALSPDLQNQLWTAIHKLQTESAVDSGGLPTNLPNLQNINENSGSGNKPPQNLSHDFDALDFELACYNQQSLFGHIVTMILYTIVCIIGLIGNTLVIYVVVRFSKMQTVTNIYILNLAIADECFLIGIPFLLYTMQKGSWQFGEFMCKAYMVSTSITQFTSSIFLLIMAADRYMAVCHPISSPRYRTTFVSKIVSGLAWLTSACFMLPVMLFANSVQIGDHTSCTIKWPEAHNAHTADSTFTWYSLALGFATPLSFIMTFYFLVIRKLHSVELKHKSKEKKRSHRKVTKLVLTVIAVYILCWLPYWIAQLVLINKNITQCATAFEILIFLLVSCLGYSNSAMNPLLYAFLSDNFKKSFLRAFSCIRKDRLNEEQQGERSILPKWRSRRRDQSREQDDGDESGYGGGSDIGRGGSCGGSGSGSYTANNARQNRKAKNYTSNASRFLGTSTAGGAGMTATSIVDEGNSDVATIEPLDVAENELLCEKTSYRNTNATDRKGLRGLENNDQYLQTRSPVLQTDL